MTSAPSNLKYSALVITSSTVIFKASVISPNIEVSNFDKSYFTGFSPNSVGKSFNSSGPLVIFLLILFLSSSRFPRTLPGIIISSNELTSPILRSIISVVSNAATLTFKFLISYVKLLLSIDSMTVLRPFSASFPVINNMFFI